MKTFAKCVLAFVSVACKVEVQFLRASVLKGIFYETAQMLKVF